VPNVRKSCTLNVIGHKLYVYGGMATGRSDSVWVMDLDCLKWKEHKVSRAAEHFNGSKCPPARASHSATTVGQVRPSSHHTITH
jgi:hypothetical protein